MFQASNGEEALQTLKKEWIDVVLADINMPVMDGVDMINEIRADSALQDTKIIVISTEGSSTRINELQDKGIKAYIHKPFTPEELNSTLIKILGDWHESNA